MSQSRTKKVDWTLTESIHLDFMPSVSIKYHGAAYLYSMHRVPVDAIVMMPSANLFLFKHQDSPPFNVLRR